MGMRYTIAALYRFTAIADAPACVARLRERFASLDICGSLLVAHEGINGTLAGNEAGIEAMLDVLKEETGLPHADVKFSHSESKPFRRLKVRLKKELITFKQPNADAANNAGAYVEARDWNALLADPDTLLIDTRNAYETIIGTFRGASLPPIHRFTEFAGYVRKNLAAAKKKKVAMFCTGGIRCEKASAFMRAEGFENVYHLKGGILRYLEDVPAEESRWQGACYVFDQRVAVAHGLSASGHTMCLACGYPLTMADKAHATYQEGVACRHCHVETAGIGPLNRKRIALNP